MFKRLKNKSTFFQRLNTSPRMLLIIMTSQHLYPLRTVWRKPSIRNLLNSERKYEVKQPTNNISPNVQMLEINFKIFFTEDKPV